MDLQKIINRVKEILVRPDKEWPVIHTEQTSNKELLLYYVLPFAAVAAIIGLITVWASTYLGVGLAIRFAVLQLLLPIITVVAGAVTVNELAENFDSTKNLNRAFKLVAYAYTPVLLINIITSISWTLGWLSILDLYSLYLLWVGLPVMMDTPENKRVVYLVAVVVVMFMVNLIIGALFGINRLGYYG